MKKLLALLLALMMVLTLTLVSCTNDKDNEDNSDGLDFDFEDPTNKPTDENGSEQPTDENGDKATDASDFTATSGKAYILHPVKVRENAKLSSKASVGVAAWGAEVDRLETNGTWTKIKFKDSTTGTEKTGYVLDEILTGDKKQVTLVKLETPVDATINGLGTKTDGTPYTLNVRTTPWNCSKSEEYANVNVLANIGNEKYQVKDGDAVQKLGTTEDGKWVWITFTKTVDGVEKVEYGFCSVDFVKVEGEEPPVQEPDNTPTVNPEPII
jgi:hypothetical protein